MHNDAFLEEGVVLEMPKGSVAPQPIHFVYFSTGEAGRLSAVRNLVLAGESCRFTLVETFAGAGSEPTLTNAVTRSSAGENSAVEHLKVQQEGPGGLHVGTLSVVQARDSRFTSHLFSTGAALARNNVHVDARRRKAWSAL